MPRDEAVSNTSPLLNLALTSRLHLLDEQFSTLLVPQQVMEELRRGEEGVGPVEERVQEGFWISGELYREVLDRHRNP